MLQTLLTTVALLATLACLGALVFRREYRATWIALTMGLGATAALDLFDLLAVLRPDELLFWKRFSLVAEGLLLFFWLFFSATYARRESFSDLLWRQRLFLAVAALLPVLALMLPISSFFYSPDFGGERVLFLGDSAFVFYCVFLVVLIIALVNLEAVLANSSRAARWRTKFELLGVAALLAVLVFYYSQGLLYRTINMNYMPLRSIALITASGMIFYSRLWRNSGSEIVISHQMAFRSLVLFAVGLYLVSLGLLGEGMRYFGDSFQRSLLMAVGFIAGVGLMVVLLSETVKRRIRVFLHKNFYRQKYDYRTQWLQFTDRLASAGSRDELLRSSVLGFCDTFGMGCGGLFLRGETSAVYREAVLLEMEPPPVRFDPASPLLGRIIEQRWVVHIPEELTERSGDEAAYLDRNSLLFAIPLVHNAVLEGFVLLGRPRNAEESYQYEDFDLMKTLARQTSSALLNLRLADELARAREMEAAGRISAFVLHDLKNLVSTLALVVDNAREYIDNPEFQVDMLDSLDNTVTRMKRLMTRLRKLEEKPALNREAADLFTVAEAAVRLVGSDAVQLSGDSVVADVDVDELQKVVLNLLLNAVEASPAQGAVTVQVGGNGAAWIRVSDQGCGMTEDFLRNRLFKPFSTTKEKGLGIGLYQCRQIVEAHGGKIDVWSEVGKGAIFTVNVPKVMEQGTENRV